MNRTTGLHTNNKILLLLAVILAVFLVFTLSVSSVAFAQGEPVQVSLGEKTVHRGQTFSMSVNVTENSGLISMNLFVDYDPTAMTLIGVKRGSGLSSMTMTTTNVETDLGYAVRPFVIFFDAVSPTTETGTVAELVFESNINAPIGDYEVSLSYDAGNTNSDYLQPVALGISGGTVHLIAGEFSAKYVDWDGTVLYEKDYNDGDVPSYVGATPARQEDACYSYAFTGWQGDVSAEVNVLQYRAIYAATPKIYSVVYYVDGYTDAPNESIDQADFYYAEERAYGANVNLDYLPKRANYTFVGWFLDEHFSQPVVGLTMPARDIRLYGYMRYNVRVADIPKIRMTYTEISETEIQVDVQMTYNPGINGMVLTLEYDRESVTFVRFTRGTALSTMQFATTNLAGGLDQENFKFYWESATNSTETGLILSMVYDVTKSDIGIYPVTFTYDETKDATYLNGTGEIWYTRLDIVGTSLPVGERYHWNEPVGEITIDVTSTDGKPLDVELKVEIADVKVADESLTRLQNKNLEIKNMYSINLVRDGEVVTSDSDLRIAIGLTQAEIESQHLSLCYIDSNGRLVEYAFSVEDDAAVFSMRNIEYWVLVGDAPTLEPVVDKSWTPEAVRTVLLPSLLSVAVLAYAILLLAKNKKYKDKLNGSNEKGGNK